jgi:hypothetical protein
MSEENKIPSRVSITYSVDLQEVPDRVKILLTELSHTFAGISKLCRDVAGNVVGDALEGTREMAEVSSLIKKTNIRVDDCLDIMIGYIQILQQIPVPPDPEKATKKKSTKKKSTKKKATKKSSKKKED